MIRIYLYLLIATFIFSCENTNKQSDSASNDRKASIQYSILKEGSIEVLNSKLETIISKDAKIEILAEGHEWTEGPLWIEAEQMLLYSDIPGNAIYMWKEGEKAKIYLQPSGFLGENFTGAEPGSNGLLLDEKGSLVLCQHGERQLARMNSAITDPVASFTTIIGQYENKRLNSPNDAIFKSNGELYFTDPPYGLPKQMEDTEKELPFQGVYKVDLAGNISLLTDELTRPNGLAFSPDEKTLYVANSDPNMAIWKAYTLDENGLISDSRIFYDVSERAKNDRGLPDGMKVDNDGVIYATGPGGIMIFSLDAELLGVIRTGQATSNCALNADQSILYITADMYLLRVRLN